MWAVGHVLCSGMHVCVLLICAGAVSCVPGLHPPCSKETKFCHDYFVHMGRQLTSSVLTHLPDDFSALVGGKGAGRQGAAVIQQGLGLSSA